MKRREFINKMGALGAALTLANRAQSAEPERKTYPKGGGDYGTELPLKERLWLALPIQASADFLHHSKYKKYINSQSVSEIEEMESRYEVLRISNEALSKIIREASQTTPKFGEVHFWHLYGMGYVIKTPTACFGIDIHHRHAEKLAPLLDFALSTHKHLDHYSAQHIAAMAELSKPYVSNFAENRWISPKGGDFTFGEISVKARPCDHPPAEKNYILNFEIDCGPKTNHCTILHIGDTHRPEQLNPSNPIDVLIAHVQGEMDLPTVTRNISPKWTLVSHLYELSWDQYRWSMASGIKRCMECTNTLAIPPIWGERLVWRGR